MASSSTRKLCTNSNGCKQPAATNCEGCSQALCTKHFIDHRRLLGEEMNVIITEHDQFQQSLNQQTSQPESHPLIKQIDEWEKASIVKIQQKAEELRLELLLFTTSHLDELSKNIRQLSEKLREAREHDSFVETDLRDWKKLIEDLKQNLASPSTVSISQHDSVPLVQNISVNLTGTNELFERVFNNTVRIEEDGHVAIHNASNNNTEIRGKNEYTSGRHTIRLSIEQSASTWTFLGINSELTPLQNKSYASKSTYGWTNNNLFWLNGGGHPNPSTPAIEMKTNDVISLIFDCDNRKIFMINERTNSKYELVVNIDHCPFPWQLHVNLFEPNSRVRILQTSS
jgi:hypothetical protein